MGPVESTARMHHARAYSQRLSDARTAVLVRAWRALEFSLDTSALTALRPLATVCLCKLVRT
jgi:hypothetical protein